MERGGVLSTNNCRCVMILSRKQQCARKKAIADGRLIELTSTARELWVSWSIAIAPEAYRLCRPDSLVHASKIEGAIVLGVNRFLDIPFLCYWRREGTCEVFDVSLANSSGRLFTATLRAVMYEHCDGERTITILPHAEG